MQVEDEGPEARVDVEGRRLGQRRRVPFLLLHRRAREVQRLNLRIPAIQMGLNSRNQLAKVWQILANLTTCRLYRHRCLLPLLIDIDRKIRLYEPENEPSEFWPIQLPLAPRIEE